MVETPTYVRKSRRLPDNRRLTCNEAPGRRAAMRAASASVYRLLYTVYLYVLMYVSSPTGYPTTDGTNTRALSHLLALLLTFCDIRH